MNKILIIGYGVVGQNFYNELKPLQPDIYDKYKTEHNTKKGDDFYYDAAFICVDTPYLKNNPCDISQVENALQENNAEIYVIKSTVLPGTVEKLKEKYGK